MGLFDKLLEQVADADREVLNRYPHLAAEVNKADDFVMKWEQWRDNNYDPDTGLTKTAKAIIDQKDAELEAMRLLQTGNDMTWDEIKGNVESLVKTQGLMTRQEFEASTAKLAYAKPDDIKATEQKINNLEVGMENLYAKTAHMPAQHFVEFGKVLKMDELFGYMRENKLGGDVEKGYEHYTAAARAEKAAAVATEKEAELRRSVREETLKEVTMRQGTLPVDSQGGSPEQTALQRRILVRKGVDAPDGAPKMTPGSLGDMAGANDAYSAYLRDQASGTKPTPVQ